MTMVNKFVRIMQKAKIKEKKADEPANNKNTEEYIALRNEINTRLTLKQRIADTVFDRFMVFLPILISVTTAVPHLVKDPSEGEQFIFDILPPVLLLLLAAYVFSSFLRYDENWNQVLAIAMYSIIISDRPLESPLMVWERGLFVQELKDSEFNEDNTFELEKPDRIPSLWNKEFAFCLCAVAILLEIYLCAYFVDTGIHLQRILEGICLYIAIFMILCFFAGWTFACKHDFLFGLVCSPILIAISQLFVCGSIIVWMYVIAIATTSAAAGYVWERSNPEHHTEKKLNLLIEWWKYAVDQGIRSNDELARLFQKRDCEVCKKCEDCEKWDKKREKCSIQELSERIVCEAALSTCGKCKRNDCTLAKIYASNSK